VKNFEKDDRFDQSDEIVKLLESMLSFNPEKRLTAEQCLKNSIFDPIRLPLLEKPSPYKVNCNIDIIDLFDYETFEQVDVQTKVDYCKSILLKEIKKIKN